MPENEGGLSDAQRKAIGDEFREIISRSQTAALTDDELRALKDMMPDLKKLVESRKVTVTIYTAVGEFAKWAGAVIAAIVAWKTFLNGGGK